MKITNKERSDYLKRIANHFGKEGQLMQTMEECGELIQECSKTIRKNERSEGLVEEIGDVTMMILQIMYLENISVQDVLNAVDYKINRTLRIIDLKEGKAK